MNKEEKTVTLPHRSVHEHAAPYNINCLCCCQDASLQHRPAQHREERVAMDTGRGGDVSGGVGRQLYGEAVCPTWGTASPQ